MKALVIGAGGGLGRQLATELEMVAQVWGTRRDLVDFSGPVDESVRALSLIAELHGPFDRVVSCVGSELVLPLRLTSGILYRRAMEQADATFAVLRACSSPKFLASGGSVVVVSSVAAHRGSAGMACYAAARAASEAMVRSAAVEFTGRRVRVNAIALGAFNSPMHSRLLAKMTETARESYLASHPLGFGSLEAAVRSTIALLSDEWCTGTVRVVDGGYLSQA